jgi:hypothetical protein
MNPGEVADRWTILRMKADVSGEMAKERDSYAIAVTELSEKVAGPSSFHLLCSMMQLMEANARIWMLEASIRKEFPDDPTAGEELGLAEIGARALQIRDFNKKRVEAKREIDLIFGATPDVKIDHPSGDA